MNKIDMTALKFLSNIKWCISITLLFLVSCTGIPDGVKPVTPFEASKYLGKWYEIARLDHSFERGLTEVYAVYSEGSDGDIKVDNFGYDASKKEWKSIQGKAYLIESPDTGRLGVTFFWPFYSSYNIIALDNEHYSYAMVCSYNKSYLWILSRSKTIDSKTLKKLITEAQSLGFNTSNLIYPQQNEHTKE
ncbi:MAG: lipocalin family protein [Lentisphaerota bacterium]